MYSLLTQLKKNINYFEREKERERFFLALNTHTYIPWVRVGGVC